MEKFRGFRYSLVQGLKNVNRIRSFFFFLKAWLIYNVVLVSGIQQSDSVFYICAVLGLAAQSCPTLCDLTICS